ncbi:MAG: FtsW/RodA/SpoVE family cell cycle protein [Bryobacteraceae bacterium]|nr:FtsW/RodA/SpoVE family cell cycle protein [Bryobacteraceae bacterium]
MAKFKPDWILFLTVVAMVAFGLVVVYSASSVVAEVKFKQPSYVFIAKQVAFAVVAFCAMLWIKSKDYRELCTPSWAFAALGVVLMLLLAAYFVDGRNHRWIRYGHAQLQPSEFAKPALALFLAHFVTRRARAINDRHTLAQAALALLVLAFTVVVADFGTAVVLVVMATAVFFVAGLQKRYFLVAGLAGVVLAGFAIASKPYRLNRIIQYFDPEYKLIDVINPGGHIRRYASSTLSPRDTAYQGLQSRIAVSTGGSLGQGLMQGKQKLMFLPEAHTDFIYAVVGEELGFLGCSALLAGFLVILWRGLRLYLYAADPFGKYLALGVTVTVVVQALINISVVLDMGPTKGIPLPMISYGGSSLLSTLISLGLLMSVSERTPEPVR